MKTKLSKLLNLQFKDVFWFGKQILTKWVFWIFIILDFAALIIQFVDPNFQFPRYVYISLALVGFFWAAFKVNQDLLTKYYALANDPSKNIPEPKTSLSITLTEGSEYNYKINDPYEEPQARAVFMRIKSKEIDGHYDEDGFLYIDNNIYYFLAGSELFINIRIINDGNVPLDILSIDSRCVGDMDNPFVFYGLKMLFENKPLHYPNHLEPGEIFLCQSHHLVGNKSDVTSAQFAASLRSINNEIISSITVDVLNKVGDRKTVNLYSKLSIRPLIDLYIAQWQSFKQTDLLRLAGIGMH